MGLVSVPLRSVGVLLAVRLGLDAWFLLFAGVGVLGVRPELDRLGARRMVRLLSSLLSLALPSLHAPREHRGRFLGPDSVEWPRPPRMDPSRFESNRLDASRSRSAYDRRHSRQTAP